MKTFVPQSNKLVPKYFMKRKKFIPRSSQENCLNMYFTMQFTNLSQKKNTFGTNFENSIQTHLNEIFCLGRLNFVPNKCSNGLFLKFKHLYMFERCKQNRLSVQSILDTFKQIDVMNHLNK